MYDSAALVFFSWMLRLPCKGKTNLECFHEKYAAGMCIDVRQIIEHVDIHMVYLLSKNGELLKLLKK